MSDDLDAYKQPDGSWLLKGHGATIAFDGQWVTIHKGYLAGGGLRAMGDRRIHVSQITGIEQKAAFFTITTADSPVRRRQKDQAKDPNTVQKPLRSAGVFSLLAVEIQRAMEASHPVPAATAAAAPDLADQLRKLGDLRDSGVLTEDEFLAKKTEILNRM